jgi:hypothetical protein
MRGTKPSHPFVQPTVRADPSTGSGPKASRSIDPGLVEGVEGRWHHIHRSTILRQAQDGPFDRLRANGLFIASASSADTSTVRADPSTGSGLKAVEAPVLRLSKLLKHGRSTSSLAPSFDKLRRGPSTGSGRTVVYLRARAPQCAPPTVRADPSTGSGLKASRSIAPELVEGVEGRWLHINRSTVLRQAQHGPFDRLRANGLFIASASSADTSTVRADPSTGSGLKAVEAPVLSLSKGRKRGRRAINLAPSFDKLRMAPSTGSGRTVGGGAKRTVDGWPRLTAGACCSANGAEPRRPSSERLTDT